jgi:hypothetical protein
MGQCDELKSSQTRGQALATLTHIGPIVKVKRKGFEEILKDETCFNKMLHATIKAYVHTFVIKCLLNPILWNYFYNVQVQHETSWSLLRHGVEVGLTPNFIKGIHIFPLSIVKSFLIFFYQVNWMCNAWS